MYYRAMFMIFLKRFVMRVLGSALALLFAIIVCEVIAHSVGLPTVKREDLGPNGLFPHYGWLIPLVVMLGIVAFISWVEMVDMAPKKEIVLAMVRGGDQGKVAFTEINRLLSFWPDKLMKQAMYRAALNLLYLSQAREALRAREGSREFSRNDAWALAKKEEAVAEAQKDFWMITDFIFAENNGVKINWSKPTSWKDILSPFKYW